MIGVLLVVAHHSFFWLWLVVVGCGLFALLGKCVPGRAGRIVLAWALPPMIAGMLAMTLISLVLAASTIATAPIAWPFKLLLALLLVLPVKVAEQLYIAVRGYPRLRVRRGALSLPRPRPPGPQERESARLGETGRRHRSDNPSAEPSLLPRWVNSLVDGIVISVSLALLPTFLVMAAYDLHWPWKLIPLIVLVGVIVPIPGIVRSLLPGRKNARRRPV